MSNQTLTWAIKYPSGSQAPNVPVDSQALAESVDAALTKATKIKHAEFTAGTVVAGTAGSGYYFKQWTATTDATTQNNTFCRQDPTAPTVGDTGNTYVKGVIEILESGVYSVNVLYLPTTQPSAIDINIGIVGGIVIAMTERSSTYGDWGQNVGHPGIYLASGQKLHMTAVASAASTQFSGNFQITKLQG